MFDRLASISDFQWLLLLFLIIIIWSLGKIVDLLRSLERETRDSNEQLKIIARIVNDDAIDSKQLLSFIASHIPRPNDYP